MIYLLEPSQKLEEANENKDGHANYIEESQILVTSINCAPFQGRFVLSAQLRNGTDRFIPKHLIAKMEELESIHNRDNDNVVDIKIPVMNDTT